jgi:hypothetical protein
MEEKECLERNDYILHDWDLKLIGAAIGLGDSLLGMPELSEKNRKDITCFQEILRLLPKATLHVIATYSFAVSKVELGFQGVNREWYVSLEENGLIEIGSIYVVVPYADERTERFMEDLFMFEPGWSRDNHPEAWLKWAREVSEPNRWRRGDQDFEIDTDFETVK